MGLQPVHWLKVGFDLGTIVVLFSFFQSLKIFAKPFKSSFYCNDYSIDMPFKSSTVTNLMLIMLCVLMPFVFLIGTEIVRTVYLRKQYYTHAVNRTRFIYKIKVFNNQIINVSEQLGNLYINCGSYFFGLAVTAIITDFVKVVVGRLRPNFLDVCKPDLNPYTDLCHAQNRTFLVPDVDFRCTSGDKPSIEDSRMSFPSGHSSISFYSMLFLIFFINQTWKFTKFGLMPRLVQFMLFSLAIFIALSRISDNKHHPTDVLAGSILGTVISIFTFCYLTDLLKKNNYTVKCYTSKPPSPSNDDDELDMEATSSSTNGSFADLDLSSERNADVEKNNHLLTDINNNNHNISTVQIVKELTINNENDKNKRNFSTKSFVK